ncbi:tetraacyldisaccharide 4'-kinase [soil metagenome]
MALTDLFAQIADRGKPKSATASAAQRAASVAAPFYGVGAYLNRVLHEIGVRKKRVLPARVISVGNITLGGTGKTPFCIWLVERLKAEGARPAILTRGYGRSQEARLVVVHDGKSLLANTRDAGDEPVLMAKALGDVPVIACANRYHAGRYAIKKFAVDTLVLDDGFQHHALARQGDIVLLDATRRLSSLEIFPRGTLRESPGALTRAHLIVLTRWQQAENPAGALREAKKAAHGIPVVRSRMSIAGASRVSDRAPISLEDLKGRKAFLLCAVGNPDSVKRTVKEAGLRLVGGRALPDHARITRAILLRADAARRRAGADYIIVTEKDAVKLFELGSIPPEVTTLRIQVEMVSPQDEAIALKAIRARLHAKAVCGYLR